MTAARGDRRETRWGNRARRGALLLGLLVFGPTPCSVAATCDAAALADEEDRSQDLARFNELLSRFRRGEDEVLTELRGVATALAEDHGRADAQDSLEHYLRLARGARIAGFRLQETFESLRGSLQAFDSARDGSWSQFREVLLEELRTLRSEAIALGDATPGAHAASLEAHLLVEQAAHQTVPEERSELLDRARESAAWSAERFDEAGQVTPTLQPIWILGRVLRAQGRPQEAHSAFASCANLAERVGQPWWREQALLGLIALARDAGSPLEVEDLLSELSSFRAPATCWPLRREAAALALSRDQLALAEEHLDSLAGLEPRNRAEGLSLLCAIQTRGGRLEEARQTSLALEQLLGHGAGPTRLARAGISLREEDWQAVRTELEKLGATSRAVEAQALAWRGRSSLALGEPEEASALLREALSVARDWQRSNAEGNGSVTGEWLGTQALVWSAQAELASGRHLAALEVLEQQGSNLRGPGVAPDLAAWAQHFELGLLSITVGADDGLALHLAPSGELHTIEIPHGRAPLQRAVERLVQAACTEDRNLVRSLGDELGAVLLPASVRTGNGLDPSRRLLIVLHGGAESIPVPLLRMGGAWLDEALTPVVLPALPAARPGEAPVLALSQWNLMGAPLVSGTVHSPLPAARGELEDAGRLLGGRHRISVGSGFTQGRLLRAIGEGRPLHLATHLIEAQACEHGLLGAVAVLTSDGPLCADAIAERRPALPLAILNACGTGRGEALDGEGLLGLSRAFLAGGTRNVLATPWPVRDQEARALLATFHRLLAAGHLPSQAARGARTELRAAGAGPADWAALRLLGRD